MIEFKRNKDTGELEAYKNGKKVGKVETMGDNIGNGKPKKVTDTKKQP